MRTRRIVHNAVAVTAALVACAVVVGLAAAPAWAHAYLTSATPAPGSTVQQSPARIVLTFAEPIDVAHSSAQLLGPSGAPVAWAGPAIAAPGDPLSLEVPLRWALPEGGYTVSWQNISEDGHPEAGVFTFGVRVPAPPVIYAPPSPGSAGVSVASDVGRWLIFCGLALLVGAAAVCWVALRGELPAGGRVLLRSAWLVAIAGVGVMMYADKALIRVDSLLPLFDTTEGRNLVALGGLVLLSGVAVLSLELGAGRWGVLAVGVTGALGMLAHVVGGHADAPSAARIANLAAQWVHLLAVGCWIGGLPWLLLAIRDTADGERVKVVSRFSTMAGAALAAVILTGLARAAVEVGSLSALTGTRYGRLLLLKFALVLVIVALGAVSRYRSIPAVRRRDDVRPLRQSVVAEIAVAAAILAVTAVLTGAAPAKTATAAKATARTAAAARQPEAARAAAQTPSPRAESASGAGE
jgi:copper transport protein